MRYVYLSIGDGRVRATQPHTLNLCAAQVDIIR